MKIQSARVVEDDLFSLVVNEANEVITKQALPRPFPTNGDGIPLIEFIFQIASEYGNDVLPLKRIANIHEYGDTQIVTIAYFTNMQILIVSCLVNRKMRRNSNLTLSFFNDITKPAEKLVGIYREASTVQEFEEAFKEFMRLMGLKDFDNLDDNILPLALTPEKKVISESKEEPTPSSQIDGITATLRNWWLVNSAYIDFDHLPKAQEEFGGIIRSLNTVSTLLSNNKVKYPESE